MNNKKTTKRALLSSVLSLVLCMAMLIGTTFAWFTDSVSSNVNTIQSGSLEIELQYQKEDGTWANAEGVTLDFKKAAGAPKDEAILWEPGCTYEIPAVKVVNKGNLAVKYEIVISGIDGDAKLNEVIDWTYNDTTLESTGTLLKGQESAAITIKGHMQETAGNEYQGLEINGISITVYATQLASESDSINNTYDTNASFLNVDADGNYLISNADELMYFAKTVNIDKNSYAGKTVKLTSNINLAGENWAPIGQTGATEFKGLFDGQGYTISNMTVNNTDTSANCASGLFGWIESHGNEGVTVKNVKFDNANVTGHHNVGVVAGFVYGTIEGCEVKNSTITAINANKDANGDKVGAIVGYVGMDASIDNNKVDKCVIKGNRDIGGIAGAVAKGVDSFANNSVKNTKIIYETEKTYASAGELVSGRTGFTPDTTNTTSGNEILQKVVTSTAEEFAAALANGNAVVNLESDVKFGNNIKQNANIDLNGNTLTMTGSDQTVTGDLNLTNGDVDVSSGYFDVRSSSDKEVVIENVTFTSTAKSKTYGNSTNRVASAVEFCPTEAGVKTTFVFRNCTFNNSNVVFEAMSGKNGAFEAIFESCTFNNFGNAEAIEVQNYLTADITIKDCTFNMTATSNIYIVDALGSSDVTVTFEGNNVVNGVAAVATTDPSLVGTVDEIKVFTTQSVKVISSMVDTVNGIDTVTVTGIAAK